MFSLTVSRRWLVDFLKNDRQDKSNGLEILIVFFVYYEWMKRELQIRPIYECRCDERLDETSSKLTQSYF